MSCAEIENALTKLRRDGVQALALATAPRPLLAFNLGKDVNLEKFLNELFILLVVDLRGVIDANSFHGYRCVSIDRLPTILASGIDVVPSSAAFFSESMEKAFEYGGLNKVLMVLSVSNLDRTYREVGVDIDSAELDDLKRTFPTVVRSEDGKKLWLSRLPECDRRIATGYETNYARWIPGDPFECLQAIVVLGLECNDVISAVRAAMESCTAISWK